MKTTHVKSNPVAKYAAKYNTAMVFVDRKSRAKRGYNKHKAKIN